MDDASPQPRPPVRPPDRRPPHRGPLRSAFSLVELLVVIGILVLLVSLSVIGFRVVGGVMRDRSTTVALENCQGLVTAFKLTNATDTLISNGLIVAACGGTSGTTDPVRWVAPGNGQAAADWTVLNCGAAIPAANPATGAFVSDPQQQAIKARYLQDETARVLKRLAQVPANASSIAAMSGNQVRLRFPRSPALVLTSTASPPEYAAVNDDTQFIDGISLLDGYGHPIVFVPAGGLYYVNFGYSGKGDKTDRASYDQVVRIRAADRQPFWASGGPDGDLSTGDDNLYSSATEATR